MMLCYGQILQRSQQEFFNLYKLETADLRPFLPDTGHLLLRVRADPQRSTTAEYSQHEMNGKHTRTHNALTADWGMGRPYSGPPILHVPHWEHNKLQIRSVQGYVFGREWTQWKALVQCLIWFLMEGNICNGNLSLGTEGLFRGFHSLALRETEIDIKAGPAHAYCRSFKWLLWRLAKWPLIRVYPNKWETIKLFFFLNLFPS